MNQLMSMCEHKIVNKDVFAFGVELIIKRDTHDDIYFKIEELNECLSKTTEIIDILKKSQKIKDAKFEKQIS